MAEYRIDDLARAAGTTSRNVRAYQERGLLPPPEKRGRVGYYNDSHLGRLKLIDSLLSRGFTTAHIADFITSWETGNDIAEVLGLENTVTERWARGETTRVPRERIAEVLDVDDDAVIDRLVSMSLARVDGDDCVLAEPELLQGFAELRQFGFTLDHLLDVHADTEELMRQIAVRIIGEAKDRIAAEHGEGWMPQGREIAAATEMLQRMRTIGTRSVHIALARAMDQALQDELGAHVAAAMGRSPREN
ncbi:MAG TPA: MerR family transcriptional regulator [Mycobacterium sp.]|nr:MerR family transcriptional regulator [Mycobacterium sp.]